MLCVALPLLKPYLAFFQQIEITLSVFVIPSTLRLHLFIKFSLSFQINFPLTQTLLPYVCVFVAQT